MIRVFVVLCQLLSARIVMNYIVKLLIANNGVCTGLYLSNFIRGGVEVLAIEVDDRANA